MSTDPAKSLFSRVAVAVLTSELGVSAHPAKTSAAQAASDATTRELTFMVSPLYSDSVRKIRSTQASGRLIVDCRELCLRTATLSGNVRIDVCHFPRKVVRYAYLQYVGSRFPRNRFWGR
jgi:hypothetical protein